MKKIAILGGGISGLSAAFHISRQCKDVSITIFEKEERLGGTIETSYKNGFQFEHGPNGFLDSKISTLDIFRQTGKADTLLRADSSSKRRYIYYKNEMRLLPSSPAAFLKTPLLSTFGKLRILLEPFIKRGNLELDETIYEFGKRRLGPEFAENFLDPMSSGIFAGNIETLSLQSCFPRISEMEQTHGSLIKALISLMRQKKANVGTAAAGPGKGDLTTTEKGTVGIISLLEESILNSVKVEKGCEINSVNKDERFNICYNQNSSSKNEEFDIVLSALPSYALSKIFKDSSPLIQSKAEKIKYSPMAVITLCIKDEALSKAIDGFGFIVPSLMKSKILGALYTSRIFPFKTTNGFEMVRIMAGGARNSSIESMSEKEIIEMVKSEISKILRLEIRPEFIKCILNKKAIPQYNKGHLLIKREIQQKLKDRFPGFFLSGNAFFGVGINDCTLRGKVVAGEIKEFLATI